jgi:choline dehydrogenase
VSVLGRHRTWQQAHGTTPSRRSYDYIIIGAGSAGCTLAGRLSETGDASVLLVEQGYPNTGWTVRMPGGGRENYKPGARYVRWYPTVPQRNLNDRVIDHPRGIGLGGSSLVNGMVFLRGSPFDYDRWEAEGARGWSYANVIGYFKRMETRAEGADDYRGGSGPVGVRRKASLDPLTEAFLQAGREAGYPSTEDVNGYRQEGFSLFDMNVDAGYRASSSYAYIEKQGRRSNLEVLTHAFGLRLVIEARRATGIEVSLGGEPHIVHAEREVIVSGGAIGSPQILLQSGIGPADDLKRLGITPRHHLPGVGQNLHDHLELDLQWECTQPVTYNRLLAPHRMALIGARWFLFKSGFAASAQFGAGAFLRSTDKLPHPNIQFHFIPICFDGWVPRSGQHGFRVSVGPMRQTSRGSLTLRSADPRDPPVLDPNYLATEHDLQELRESYALAQEIVGQMAFDPYRGRPLEPPVMPRDRIAIDEVIRNHCGSGFHLCGTCKMGNDSDTTAVVDADTRVIGLEGVRVVDASIMPSIVSSNLNAPVMMMAERASDLILGRSLPAEHVPFHRPVGAIREARGTEPKHAQDVAVEGAR